MDCMDCCDLVAEEVLVYVCLPGIIRSALEKNKGANVSSSKKMPYNELDDFPSFHLFYAEPRKP